MSNITFYTNPMSRGQIARWALHEAGAEYSAIILDYGSTMKDADFLAINPMGKVPAIVHEGHTVTECAAICAYLAETFPETGLAPRPDERADYYRWLFFTAGPLEQAITDKNLGIVPTADQERMAGYGNLDRVIDTLHGHLSGREYVCGKRFTMADVYVGSHVDWGLQFGTLPRRDGFVAYAERMRGRDAYKAAKAIDTAEIEEMQRKG